MKVGYKIEPIASA